MKYRPQYVYMTNPLIHRSWSIYHTPCF